MSTTYYYLLGTKINIDSKNNDLGCLGEIVYSVYLEFLYGRGVLTLKDVVKAIKEINPKFTLGTNYKNLGEGKPILMEGDYCCVDWLTSNFHYSPWTKEKEIVNNQIQKQITDKYDVSTPDLPENEKGWVQKWELEQLITLNDIHVNLYRKNLEKLLLKYPHLKENNINDKNK